MAVFVFLPTSTRTEVISPYLFLHADRLQFLRLSLLGVAIPASSCRHTIRLLFLSTILAIIGLLLRGGTPYASRILHRYLTPHQNGYRFGVDVIYHCLEEVERLQLIDQQRIFKLE